MPRVMALVLLLVVAIASGPGSADAGGAKIVVRFGPAPPPRVVVPPGSQVIINAPSRVFVAPPSQITVNAPSRIIVGPAPVWGHPAPFYVYQPRRCVVPGSWAYTWIPQTSTSDVWVDGQYSSDSLWVEGHWERRVYTSGSYQPYWIPERWTSC